MLFRSDQIVALCTGWASAVDGIELTFSVLEPVLAVLFGMIDSSHWRTHIIPNKWKLLEHFTSVPDDFKPLKRCLDNPELINAISELENPVAMVLWLAILWSKYKELIPEVRLQLETVTTDVAQSSRKADLDVYLSTMDSELGKAEESLTKYTVWSIDPTAVALRTRIDNLRQARASLLALTRS